MVARNWILLACLGAALVAPACSLIIGAHELPEGSGGSSPTGSATSSSGSSSSSSTGMGSSSGTTSTTTSWATTGTCDTVTPCSDCLFCMKDSVCAGVGGDAGCEDGGTCDDYVRCTDQCPQGTSYASCVKACGSTVPTAPGYTELHDCMCAQCGPTCTDWCK